jgi:hypothetical protein
LGAPESSKRWIPAFQESEDMPVRIRYVIWMLFFILAVVLAVLADDRLTRVLWVICAIGGIGYIFFDRRFPKKDKTPPSSAPSERCGGDAATGASGEQP